MSVRSEKWKQENDFFINKNTGKIQYNKMCLNCINTCKVSHKAIIVVCPVFRATVRTSEPKSLQNCVKAVK